MIKQCYMSTHALATQKETEKMSITEGYAAGAEGAVGVTSFIPRAEQSGFGRARISASTRATRHSAILVTRVLHTFLSILYPEGTVVTGTSFSLFYIFREKS